MCAGAIVLARVRAGLRRARRKGRRHRHPLRHRPRPAPEPPRRGRGRRARRRVDRTAAAVLQGAPVGVPGGRPGRRGAHERADDARPSRPVSPSQTLRYTVALPNATAARRGVRAGLRSATGNRVGGGNLSRGFESHPLRPATRLRRVGRICGEVAELAESGGLENRYASRGASGVRIPPSPPFAGKTRRPRVIGAFVVRGVVRHRAASGAHGPRLWRSHLPSRA